jgi:hypothetical protein
MASKSRTPQEIDPVPDLPKPHLRLRLGRAGGDQGSAQLVAREADKVPAPTLGKRRGTVRTSCVIGAVGWLVMDVPLDKPPI